MSAPTQLDVLDFWFSERSAIRWFATDPVFDDEIRQRFGATVAAAADRALEHWPTSGEGALALTIVLDQFPRNIHRGSPRAFAHDALARRVAAAAIERGFDQPVGLERRMFFYLPFEHSESLEDQVRSVELFSRWAAEHDGSRRAYAEDQMTYVHRHHEIIRRFGRFPHRNAVLGRSSTPAELAFLKEPCSSF